VSPTAAAIYRLIEPLRPTLCLDEMEKLNRSESTQIESVLNAGYKRGARVPRVEEVNGTRTVVDYDVYAPVALAGIQGLNHVLADRAITVLMQKGHDKTRVNTEVDMESAAFAGIRAMGYRLALTAGDQVLGALAAVTAKQDSFKHLAGRPLELYRAVIALALLASTAGDPSFMSDLNLLVKEDTEQAAQDDPEMVRLFTALEKLLQVEPTITVYPGKLIPDEWGVGGYLDGGPTGKLLQQHGFLPSPRTKEGVPYKITRERFLAQAHLYEYEVMELGAVGSAGSTV
jgi:hypothetical protein